MTSRITLALAAIGLFVVGLGVAVAPVAVAAPSPGINKQVNFQGRLLDAFGGVIADGNYNMQFKLYKNGDGLVTGDTTCTIGDCASTTGTLLWTEEWLNQASHSVVVKNGYFSVSLGSITALPSNMNEPVMWLSMNVAGGGNATSPTCTPFSSCTGDGEMLPMKRLSSAVYALQAENANTLGGLSSAGFIQNGTGQQTANFNIVSAATGSIGALVQGAASATVPVMVVRGGATPGTGGDLLQLQDSLSAVTAKFTKDGFLGIGVSGTLTHQLQVQGSTGAQIYATGSTNSTSTATNWLRAPLNTVSVFVGDNDSTSGYAANDFSGNVRFNGTSVAWGDLGYYPNGGGNGNNGQFRLSVTGTTVDTTPDAKLGVGELYVAGNTGIGTNSPGFKLDVVGTINSSSTVSATTSVVAPLFDTASAVTLNVGTNNASGINLNQNTLVNSKTLTVSVASNAGALTVTNGSSNVLNVDTSSTRVTVGSGATCTGRFCVAQNITGAGGGSSVNAYNITSVGVSTGSTVASQKAILNDTSSSVANTLQGYVFDASGTTNTSANITAISAKVNSANAGNLLQLTSGSTDVVLISNTGAAVLQNQANSAAALQVRNLAGTDIFNVDTTNAKIGTANQSAASTPSAALTIKSGDASGTGGGSGSGAVVLDSGSSTNGTAGNLSIGNGAYAHNTTIGNITGTTAVSIQGGASGSINIGTVGSATAASTTHIADTSDATGTQSVTIGSSAKTNNALILEAGNTGKIQIGNSTAAHTIQIGNGGTAAQAVVLGSTSSSSAATINAGSGNVLVNATSGTVTLQTTTSGQINIVPGGSSNIVIGTSDTTGTLLVLDTKTDAGDPTGVDGGMYYNSNSKAFRCYQNAQWRNCLGALAYAQTSVQAGDTVANNAAETDFATTYTLPANDCQVGRVYRVAAAFSYDIATTTPTLAIRLKWGSTTVVSNIDDSGTPPSIGTADNSYRIIWSTADITCISTGSSGTVEAQGQMIRSSGTGNGNVWQFGQNATVTVNTTTTNVMKISADWSAANAGNTITMRSFVVEALGGP